MVDLTLPLPGLSPIAGKGIDIGVPRDVEPARATGRLRRIPRIGRAIDEYHVSKVGSRVVARFDGGRLSSDGGSCTPAPIGCCGVLASTAPT